MKTDIEIAQDADLKPIEEIAAGLDLEREDWEPYGHTKAKLSDGLLDKLH
ncbi:formate--tetrahydrofolate ligase, partial [Lentibacillus sp.]